MLNNRMGSVILNKGLPDKEDHGIDDINEDAPHLELMEEFMSAIKEEKAEKALRAIKMLVKILYDEYESEEDMYDGMKFAESKD
jgi:hypothetical protein